MWIQFAICCLVLCAYLYLPGYLVDRALGLGRVEALLVAPVASIFGIEALSALYVTLGLPCNPLTIMAPLTLLAALAQRASVTFRRRRAISAATEGPGGKAARIPWWAVALNVSVPMAIGALFFLGNLASPNGFVQGWDNAFHVNVIHNFVKTETYPFIGPSSLAVDGEMVRGSGFYPTTFHTLAALVVSTTAASVPMSINAVNFVASFLVFPTGALLMSTLLFPGNRSAQLSSELVSVAFVAFPWRLLTWGPIFPNLLANCLLFHFIYALAPLCLEGSAPKERLIGGALSLVCLADLALTQPNACFSAGIMAFPLIAVGIIRGFERAIPCGGLYVGAAAAVAFTWATKRLWTLLLDSAFLSGVTSMWWRTPDETSLEGILDTLNMSLPGSADFADPPAQYVLTALVLIGLTTMARRREGLWWLWSVLLIGRIGFVNMAREYELRKILAGFWYRDPARTSALMAIVFIPLAVRGAAALIELVRRGLERSAAHAPFTHPPASCAAPAVVLLALCALNFLPALSSAFRAERASLQEAYAEEEATLDAGEVAFLRKVEEIVPEDALILNQAYDGSVFAYGVADVEVWWRSFYAFSYGDETTDLLLQRLDEAATDEEVQAALREVGATYLLLLDADGGNERTTYLEFYDPAATRGLEGVDEATPGFELVLSEDDMRLYRIVAPGAGA